MRITRPALAALVLACSSTTLLHAAVITVPAFTVTSLSHTTSPLGDGASSANATPPSLGSYTKSSFAATLAGHDTLNVSIVAPAGQKFVYTPAAGASSNTMRFIGDWLDASTGSLSNGPAPTSVTITFVTPTGPVSVRPNPSQSYIGGPGKSFRFSESIPFNFAFTPRLEFTELDISATYNTSITSPSASQFSSVFFDFDARATGSAVAPDTTLLSLQPLPEPTAALPIAAGIAMLARTRRRVS